MNEDYSFATKMMALGLAFIITLSLFEGCERYLDRAHELKLQELKNANRN